MTGGIHEGQGGGYRWTVSETSPTAAGAPVAAPKGADVNATTVVSLAGGKFLYIYDTDPSSPHIFPSDKHVDIDDINFQQPKVPEDLAYLLEFEDGLANANIKEKKLTKEQVDKLRTKFYLGNELEVADVKVEEGSDEFQAFLEKFFGAKRRAINNAKYKEYLSKQYDKGFEKQLYLHADANDITDEAQLNQIRLARHGIGGKEYEELAKELEAKGIRSTNEHYGIPGDQRVVELNSQTFIDETDLKYSEAYLEVLEGAKDFDPLTKKQLEHIFNNPEDAVKYPNGDKLVALNATLIKQAADKAGFPGLTLSVNNKPYNGMIHHASHAEVAKLIDADPKLQGQKQMLMAMLRGPRDKWSETIEELASKAAKKLTVIYGLPPDFRIPQGPPPISPVVNQERIQTAQAGIANMESQIATLRELVNTLPVSSEMRMKLIDFIKIISRALQELKELLYRLQSDDSRKASKLGFAKTQDNIAKIEIQKKQMEEMRAEMEKQKVKNTVMQVLGGVALALTAIAFIATGNVVGLLIVVAIAASMYIGQATHGKSLFAVAFEKMDEIEPSWAADAVKIIAILAVVALAAFGGAAVASMALSSVLMESHLIKDWAMDLGASEEHAMYWELGISIGIGLASFGGAKGVQWLKKGDEVADVAEDVSKASTAADYISRGAIAAAGVSQAAGSTAGMALSLSQARLAELKGKFESDIVEIEAMIEMLQKLLDKFLSALSGRTDFIETVSETQNALWAGLSESADQASSGII